MICQILLLECFLEDWRVAGRIFSGIFAVVLIGCEHLPHGFHDKLWGSWNIDFLFVAFPLFLWLREYRFRICYFIRLPMFLKTCFWLFFQINLFWWIFWSNSLFLWMIVFLLDIVFNLRILYFFVVSSQFNGSFTRFCWLYFWGW